MILLTNMDSLAEPDERKNISIFGASLEYQTIWRRRQMDGQVNRLIDSQQGQLTGRNCCFPREPGIPSGPKTTELTIGLRRNTRGLIVGFVLGGGALTTRSSQVNNNNNNNR